MSEGCVLAVSGTPGVGKTHLSALMADHGWDVVSLASLAEEHGCLDEVDPSDGAAPIDIHRLADAWVPPAGTRVVVDGHLAHLLDVDGVVLLRCAPETLAERLERRGYDDLKVRANVEWELTAGHWAELLEFEVDHPLIELDATTTPPSGLLEAVQNWVDGGMSGLTINEQAPSALDWLSEHTP